MSKDHAKTHATKREQIYYLLSDREWHTAKELNKVGGVRYSARLLELKRLGYKIESKEVEGKNYKSYRLASILRGPCQGKRVKVLLDEGDVDELLESGILTLSAEAALKDALGSFRTNKHKL